MSRKEVAKKVAQLTIFNPNPKSSKDLWQKNLPNWPPVRYSKFAKSFQISWESICIPNDNSNVVCWQFSVIVDGTRWNTIEIAVRFYIRAMNLPLYLCGCFGSSRLHTGRWWLSQIPDQEYIFKWNFSAGKRRYHTYRDLQAEEIFASKIRNFST